MAASLSPLPPPGVLRHALLTPTARHAPAVAAGDRVRAGDEAPVTAVLNGRLDEFIDELATRDQAQKLAASDLG